MTKKRTDKQEAFCKEFVLNGGNASDAYRFAYDAENMQPETINVKACELKGDGNISVRIEELHSKVRESQEKQFIWDAVKKKEILVKVAEDGMEDGDNGMRSRADVVKAVNELNKMDGDYAPSKVQINTDPIDPSDRQERIRRLAEKCLADDD